MKKPYQHIKVQKFLDDQSQRLETGAVCVNLDWPGLFIRGDSCHGFLMRILEHLQCVLEGGNAIMTCQPLLELVHLLDSPVHYGPEYGQYVSRFLEELDNRFSMSDDPKKPLYDPKRVSERALSELEAKFREALSGMLDKTWNNASEEELNDFLKKVVIEFIDKDFLPWWSLPTIKWEVVASEGWSSLKFNFRIPGKSDKFFIQPFKKEKDGNDHGRVGTPC